MYFTTLALPVIGLPVLSSVSGILQSPAPDAYWATTCAAMNTFSQPCIRSWCYEHVHRISVFTAVQLALSYARQVTYAEQRLWCEWTNPTELHYLFKWVSPVMPSGRRKPHLHCTESNIFCVVSWAGYGPGLCIVSCNHNRALVMPFAVQGSSAIAKIALPGQALWSM